MLLKINEIIFKFRYLFLACILILGLFLRNHNLYTWPRLGATFDEYAWTWLGMSLIENHVPSSWSPQPQYKTRKVVVYQKAYFQIVKPYLEHPPLFGLVAGSYALATGVKDIFSVDLNHIRGLAVLLGVLSIFMIYIFAAQVYDYKIGLISSLIYAVVPTIVIGSRIVQNENFFIPFFILSLFTVSRFLKTQNPWLRNLSAVICGLLILAKIPWATAAFAIVLIFMFNKRYKDIFKFLAIVVPIALPFVVYGFYYDWKLFIDLFAYQLQRYDITFNSFFAIFTSPYLVDRFMIDGWIYFGWIAIFLLGLKDIKKNYMVILPFFAYLFVFIFAVPNEPSHGWYRYPFYPFLIIASALFIKEYFTKNYFLTFIFLIFTGLSLLQLSWAQSIGFSFIVLRSFLILFGISLAPLFLPKTEKIAYLTSMVSLSIIFFLSIWSVFKYNEQ